MTEKPKPHSDQSHAKPNEHGKEEYKRHIDGTVRVIGQVEVNSPPDSVKEKRAERNKENSYRKKNFIVSLITLFAIVIYAAITFWQGCLTQTIAKLTQQTYETSQRPYIGVSSVDGSYYYRDSRGVIQTSKALMPQAEGFNFRVEIKNFGPVPGSDFYPSWKVFLDGVQLASDRHVTDTPSTLYPSQVTYLQGGFLNIPDKFDSFKNGAVLEIETTIRYSGPTGQYPVQCERNRYSPKDYGFAVLGKCQH